MITSMRSKFANLLLISLFFTACRSASPNTDSNSFVASDSSRSGAIDIPEDNRILTKIARGTEKINSPAGEQEIYTLVQDLYQRKYDEKEDEFRHKANGAKLTADIAKALGYPDVASFAKDFETGRFQNTKIYTNENVDPLSNKGDKIPNYVVMNQALRKYPNLAALEQNDPKAASLIKTFESSYSQLPPVKGLVFRGNGMNSGRLKEIIEKGVMEDAGYTSTSIDVFDAYFFLGKVRNSPTKTRVFEIIYGRSGRFIPFGEFSKEEEVLFPHGTKFKLHHHFLHKDEDGQADLDAVYLFLEEM